MAQILIGVLGYGERPPNVEHLLTLCQLPDTEALLLTWSCPGQETTGVLRRLQAQSPKIRVESGDVNLGSAGGYARLVARAAVYESWEYLLLLDDDLAISPESLGHLVSAAEADPLKERTLYMTYRRGLTELRLLVEEGRPLRDIRPGACVGFHFLNFVRRGTRNSSRIDGGRVLIESAPYGGLAIPRICMSSLGMPKPELFLYADDAEWTLRFTRSGGLIRLIPEASVMDRSPSWNATESVGGNLTRRVLHLGATKAYYEARNRTFLARMYYPGSPMAYGFNRLIFLAALYFVAILNLRFARARLLHRAVKDGEKMACARPEAWPSPPQGLD